MKRKRGQKEEGETGEKERMGRNTRKEGKLGERKREKEG
jgi:hypothetical protein